MKKEKILLFLIIFIFSVFGVIAKVRADSVSACIGRNAGIQCSYTDSQGRNVNGVCGSVYGVMMCNSTDGPLGASNSCTEKNTGDACSYTNNGQQINGVCDSLYGVMTCVNTAGTNNVGTNNPGNTSSGSATGVTTQATQTQKQSGSQIQTEPTIPNIPLPNPKGGIQEVLLNILRWLLQIVGIIALISFIISGIQYFTAAGDETKAESAKRNLTYSIIGAIVIFASFVIVQAIQNALAAKTIF